MTKENWIKHMEATGLVRPSLGGDKNTWKGQQVSHRGFGCKECLDRVKTMKANIARQTRDGIMKDMGLTKVYGAVSGKVYWE